MAVSLGRRRRTHFGFQTAPYRRHIQQALSLRKPCCQFSAAPGLPNCAPVRRHQHTFRFAAAQVWSQVSARRAAFSANQPEEQLIRLLALQQTHRGREIRRPFHLDAPDGWPGQSFEPRWWNWRRVFATPWRFAEERVNVLELRAFLGGSGVASSEFANIGSRLLMLMDSAVVLGCRRQMQVQLTTIGPNYRGSQRADDSWVFSGTPGFRRVGAQPGRRAQQVAIMPVRKKNPCPASTSASFHWQSPKQCHRTTHLRQICSRLQMFSPVLLTPWPHAFQ